MFHVGAGALSLSVDPGRASAPGIFVGPGAVGLALGMYLGKMADTPRWPFFVLLVLGLLVLPLVSVAPAPAREEPRTAAVGQAEGVAIVLLLLFSVLVRSFVGMAGFHAVHKTVAVGFAIATAAFAGKAVGGFVADRVGWIRSSVGALLVSAPVIAFGAAHTYAMVAAMFVFQMTMPVTLVALTVVMPRRPAFSFGVACVALVAGAIPTFFPPVHRFYSDVGFFALILTSALSLAVALHRVGRRAPSGHPVDSAPEADRALAS
jgi:FSR family fosmidomycin resistance protein-like MFS transporter